MGRPTRIATIGLSLRSLAEIGGDLFVRLLYGGLLFNGLLGLRSIEFLFDADKLHSLSIEFLCAGLQNLSFEFLICEGGRSLTGLFPISAEF